MAKALSMLFALTFFLSGCETVQGVGRDVQNAGEALEEAVEGE